MKKLLSLLVLVATLIALVGCVPDFLGLGEKPSRGSIDGDAYMSEYLGLEFTKPAHWRYYSDEEIASIMNIAADNLLEDKFKEALEKNPAIYDMMAVDDSTGTNISVSYENLLRTLSLGITVEEYVEAMKEQFTEVTTMQVTFPDELEKVKLGEVEFTRCVCTTKTQGITMIQAYYFRKSGGYMTIVLVTVRDGYSVEEIENMFD